MNAILERLIAREGGYVDHPLDRGGPTKYGITRDTLAVWRGVPVTAEDVEALTAGEAKDIYLDRYITRHGLDTLDLPLDIFEQLVDHAVLCGPRTAIQDLQAVIGVRNDGIVGPVTRAAVTAALPGGRLGIDLAKERITRLVGIVHHDHSQIVFLSGWISRAISFL